MNNIEKAKYLPNPEIDRDACVPECMGCNKMYTDLPLGQCVLEDHVCIAYVDPSYWHHKMGKCPLQSNKKEEVTTQKKVNPIKASKRLRRRGFK